MTASRRYAKILAADVELDRFDDHRGSADGQLRSCVPCQLRPCVEHVAGDPIGTRSDGEPAYGAWSGRT